ncbi:hypothetical protein [Mesorhizobium sp. M0207]|uniref:hypothetical protein n=1 Tax=Mesorhizobium sp. M0207 TaxID=2956915 RepID=UPI00333A95AD
MVFFGTIGFIAIAVGIALLVMRVINLDAASPAPRWLVIVAVYGANLGLAAGELVAFFALSRSGRPTDWLFAACIMGSCLAGAVSMLEASGRVLKGKSLGNPDAT